MTNSTHIDERTRQIAALKAFCDPRTIDRVMRGEPVKGMVAERARAALMKLGITPPPAERWLPPTRRAR